MKTMPDHASRALERKIMWRVLPFLFIGYVVAFIDRVNIGFAQLQMSRDLGFTDSIYGFAAGIFFLGYVLFEVPSNALLHKYGAKKTFVRILLAWGLVSMCMAIVKTPFSLYALRALLGVCEAGFFPGVILYLTYWVPVEARARATSIFFCGTLISGVLSGILSGSIMHYTDHLAGLRGWQWLFILEGAPAIILGVVAIFVIDDSPEAAKWLTDEEKGRLQQALKNEREASSGTEHERKVSTDVRVYLFSFVYFAIACSAMAISFWLPAVIKSIGVEDVMQVGMYSAIPYLVGTFSVLLIARNSDRTGDRIRHFVACTAVGGGALTALAMNPRDLTTVLVLLTVAVSGIFSAIPVFWSTPQGFFRGRRAAIALALISSLGQIGGFVSPVFIGYIKTSTGRMDNALYFFYALLLCGAAVLCVLLRKKVGLQESQVAAPRDSRLERNSGSSEAT